MAVPDENKVKLIEAGVLPHYVKLLGPERTESEQKQAAHGLWMLAFKCRDSVKTACLDGWCHYTAIAVTAPLFPSLAYSFYGAALEMCF